MDRPRSRAYAQGIDGSHLAAFAANVHPGTVFLAITETLREDQEHPDTGATYLTPDDAIALGTELIALGAQLRDRG